MTTHDEETSQAVTAERVTSDEARRRAGAPPGIEPDAPDYTEDTGTTTLGVNEPRVNPRERGDEAPASPRPPR